MNEQLIQRDDNNGITHLSLNRTEKYNALSTKMIKVLQNHLDAISKDKKVRVVIIKSNGKAFSTGHDLKEIRQSDDINFHRSLFKQCSNMMLSIIRLPKPVIASVNGIATAAGCQLVASCDLAVCTSNSIFAVSGVNYGLFCSTPAVALSRCISQKRALQMLLTGEFIDAKQALEYGLVNEIAPENQLEEVTLKIAKLIAAKPPEAIALGKEMFYKQLAMGLSDAYDYASEQIVCNLHTDEAREGIDAFLQKRQPNWK